MSDDLEQRRLRVVFITIGVCALSFLVFALAGAVLGRSGTYLQVTHRKELIFLLAVPLAAATLLWRWRRP